MQSLPGREAARRAARAKLEPVRQTYVELLASRWGAIFVGGEKERANAFAILAVEHPAVAVNAKEFYRTVAKAVEGSMRADRLIEPTQFAHISANLERLAKDLGFNQTPTLKFRNGIVAKTVDDLALCIRTLIEDAGAGDIPRAYVRRQIGNKASEICYQQAVLPVVVVDADATDQTILSPLFRGRLVQVTLGDETPTQESTESAFKALKALYKK
jgi:hypothetical protein